MFVTVLVNFIVGLLVGWSGIAGFLLPVYFTSVMGLPVPAALALSFFDFAISGLIGANNYRRKGNLDLRSSLVLGAGSLLGAMLGVRLNLAIPELTAKRLLYAVVLLSGISILARKDTPMDSRANGPRYSRALRSAAFVLALGGTTGALCALSGAGGPVLTMPLLILLGMGVHTAIGTSLLNSVFIALPAFVGYMGQSDPALLTPLLIVCGLSHGAGVFVGSRTAHRIRQRPLKTAIAVLSITIALVMILKHSL